MNDPHEWQLTNRHDSKVHRSTILTWKCGRCERVVLCHYDVAEDGPYPPPGPRDAVYEHAQIHRNCRIGMISDVMLS